MDDVVIDGSLGEGGGQVLRSSLSLAAVTGRPVRVVRVRARRRRPGLRRQHLAAVQAAAEVTGGAVDGAELGSSSVRFAPGPVRAGTYRFAIGTAGSATLVAHTVLPILLAADGPSTVRIEGGTHNPMAPPFEHLAEVFLPVVQRMGPAVDARLHRHGFAPAGGGSLTLRVTPAPLRPVELLEPPTIRRIEAVALLAQLPAHIAHRELAAVGEALGLPARDLRVQEVDADGPGNALLIRGQLRHGVMLASAVGELRKPAERVATEAIRAFRSLRDHRVPVGPHLADQLLLPLAMAGGGAFRTLPLTPHARTHLEVIGHFLTARFTVGETRRSATVRVEGPSGSV
ncbi:MAG: RNA 3'-terminal phosphate cyclase [Sandaracinaceae bacterium]